MYNCNNMLLVHRVRSVLGMLADCFEAFPDLYLATLADQEAGQRPVKELLDRAINHPIMRASPEVRACVLAACVLACTSGGAWYGSLGHWERYGGLLPGSWQGCGAFLILLRQFELHGPEPPLHPAPAGPRALPAAHGRAGLLGAGRAPGAATDGRHGPGAG